MLENFTKYKRVLAKGVILPQVHIGQRFYDELKLPNTTSNYDFLRRLCWKGIQEKGIDKLPNKQEYYDRVRRELETFEELGFSPYILLNWQVLNFCLEEGIVTGKGRGSCVGSLVLFLLQVTAIDPIPNKLYFERFVSKNRAKKIIDDDGTIYLDGSLLPDCDHDIEFISRAKVISFINDKFNGQTSKILTLNTLSGKMCMKECMKIAEGCSEDEANQVSDSIPKKFGKVLDFEDAEKESEKFLGYTKQYSKAYKIAKKLEGLPKNTGVHPSGIAICSDMIDDNMPLQMTKEGEIISGFEMGDVGSLMVKFDILGLRTLSVIEKTARLVGIDPKTFVVPADKTYIHLQNLIAPQGIFQIETDVGFGVCQKVKPSNLSELSDVLSLSRPGSFAFVSEYCKVKEGSQEIAERWPSLDNILKETKGTILFQESLMQIAAEVFGLTLLDAESIRRAVGKKDKEKMKLWEPIIYEQAKKLSIPEGVAKFYWDTLIASAEYSFNKSHAIAYSTTAELCVYLKFNYPKEFFLSLLEMTHYEPDPLFEISKISQELQYFNIKLLQPDLVKSQNDFSIQGENIRFGLKNIRGISEKTSESLNTFRDKPKSNKFEVFNEAKEAGLNIGNLCALIQAGCLDSFNTERSLLVLEAQIFNKLTAKEKLTVLSYGEAFSYDVLKLLKAVGEGKILNDKGKPIINDKRLETLRKDYTGYKALYDHNCKHQKFCHWFFERKLLGYSYSETLRDVFKDPKEKFSPLLELISIADKDEVVIVGVVTEYAKSKSKKNDKAYLRVNLSDEGGKTTLLFFDKEKLQPKQEPDEIKQPMSFWMKNNKLAEDSILIVAGKKSGDVVFVDNMKIVETEVFLKTSQLKD